MTIRPFRRMQTALLGAAMALLAPPLPAQSADCCQWELRVERQRGGAVAVELYAHFPEEGYAFFDGGLDIRAEGATWISSEICGDGLTGSPGEIDGSDVRNIYIAHDRGAGSPIRTNPMRVWCGELKSVCEEPETHQVWTEGRQFSYYVTYPGLDLKECTPRDSAPGIICSPIVIPEWAILSPFPGTGFTVKERDVEMFPDGFTSPFGAIYNDLLHGWLSPDAAIDVQIGLAGQEPGMTIDTSWFTHFRCGEGRMSMRLGLEPGAMLAWPDFTGLRVSLFLVDLHLAGKIIGEVELKSGAPLAMHGLGDAVLLSLEKAGSGGPAIALGHDAPFVVIDPSGGQHQVDRLVFTPINGPGALLGMDMIEISVTEAKMLLVTFLGGRGGCYADCDGSGALDFFDFLCFQNRFAAGAAEADCDESGQLDFFDFLCFQNAFAAGCP